MSSDGVTPVVFVHGLVGTLADPLIVEAFDAPTFAPSLLGYGEHAAASPIDVDAQVAHLEALVGREVGARPVHLVGHSLGGVIAMIFAHRHPDRVAEIVSVEGNFTLKDAFWSSHVARLSVEEAEAMLAGFRADPTAWLARSGIAPSEATLTLACRWLARQPGSTLRAMSEACVELTGDERYLPTVREVFAKHRVHLVSGERSHAAWDVPGWARAAAASETILKDTGHLMMLEDPRGFAQCIASTLGAR